MSERRGTFWICFWLALIWIEVSFIIGPALRQISATLAGSGP